MLEVARKMRGPDGTGRVMVLDIGHSSSKYHVHLGNRASRHAYYLRPPEGMTANDLKRILDEAGGEGELEFRYYIYPELETELKPVLTADPFATKHFVRNSEQKFLQIEGERPKARETIHQLLDALKDPFRAESFPKLDEFMLNSFTPATDDRRAELVLLKRNGERDELRKAEPGFHVALAEHGFASEIDLYRPTVGDSEPVLFLTTNETTGDLAHAFLADMASYFESSDYVERSKLADKKDPEPVKKQPVAAPPSYLQTLTHAPRIERPKLDERQLVAKVAQGIKELLPTMKLLQKREFAQIGPYVTIQFPGKLGFGKGPSEGEMKELEAIYRALQGDPSFGSDWHARYQIDSRTGEMRIAPSYDAHAAPGWTAISHYEVVR